MKAKVKKFLPRCKKENVKVEEEGSEYLIGRVAGSDGGVVAKAKWLTCEQIQGAL